MIRQIKLTANQERCLREQVFTADEPGPVLRDFQTVLDFLRFQGGVEAAGKYNVFPMKYIAELDRCLSRPLHLDMKRPLLKSHPPGMIPCRPYGSRPGSVLTGRGAGGLDPVGEGVAVA
jgi:hypothetical protein